MDNKHSDYALGLIKLLTLEEKVSLVAGHNFMETVAIPRLNIPKIRMSDGPHGLRTQTQGGDNGVGTSLPATCFPTASCSANTFNPDLIRQVGNAIAEEAHLYGVNILLGPGVNIKKNPLGGRNFEYFSEDPYLTGVMGASEVIGLQEKGVGVSLKHFALNNSENYRFLGNFICDERALREIYLKQFEYIVKTAKPETLMCSYIKMNGTYCCENKWLLKDVLRDEWGFNGVVMSDWGATHNRVKGVVAGLDLEMPGDAAITLKWVYDAVNDGSLDITELDEAVLNILDLVNKHKDDELIGVVDWEKHHELAKEVALEGAVLLKNNDILPLQVGEPVLIVGELFEKMRYQGSGSSMINPQLLCSPKQAFDHVDANYQYVKGYKECEFTPNQHLIHEAVKATNEFDKVIVFLGLTDYEESEGADRENMSLPSNQLALIDALVKTGKKIVVVLFGGSPIELPFINEVDAAIDMFLPGQNGGSATYDLLFGKANPSGRLSETWPIKYSDVPFSNEFASARQEIYKDSIYVGYRYYATKKKPVRFPFGYGLSYSSYEYSCLKVKKAKDKIIVNVDVTNTGKVAGKETVQIYVYAPKGNVHKPIRELKGFTKVFLQPCETKTVEVILDKNDLTFYDINEERFVVEDGVYNIEVGRNVEEILLTKEIQINGEIVKKTTQKAYELLDFDNLTIIEYEKIWKRKIPLPEPIKPITLESRFTDLRATFFGRILYNAVIGVAKKQERKARRLPEGKERDNKLKGAIFLRRILDTNSLITLAMSSSGEFPYQMACGFKELANGHLIRAIKEFRRKIKPFDTPIRK